MDFIGEHLLPGQIGQFSIYLAFVSALLSAFAYWRSTQSEDGSWKKLARTAFKVHAISILAIVVAMAYMIFNHYFEYQYVWKHSSTTLPLEFIISCFWEGQEGSFLLWIFWHVVLGSILLFRKSKWEAPVLMIVGLVQAFLVSMILGVYIFDIQIGNSPFILVRELPEYIHLPFMQMPDYLNHPQFADGRGLNPLLQNYWMVIHPPILHI
jgi:cytochrome c-type biogenesis protein CcmF